MRIQTPLLSSVVLLLTLSGATAFAQQGLKGPQPSPAATVSQVVGVTEMKVDYHRPAVGGRPVWGKLVPYGEVWRAGANENTTVSFSTPVKVGGKVLAAGTYGLHMIPNPKQFTVIFSTMSVAWGSFSYDEKEDAARVTVTTAPSEAPEERLSYRFDNVTETGTALTLRWEKLKVPVQIDVDTPAAVMASYRAQLRGPPKFNAAAWSNAARYWLTHGGDLNEAKALADQGVQMNETFLTLHTRAQVADKQNDSKLADELRTKALAKANEVELNQYGYELLGQKKVDEAIGIFQKNVQTYPSSWNVYDSLAETYLAKGDKKLAAENYGKALTLVKDDANKKRIEATLAKLKK